MFRLKKFFCLNDVGCLYAYNDHLYSTHYFHKHKGTCNGTGADGCGNILYARKRPLLSILFLPLLLSVLAANVGYFVLYPRLFPPVFQHIVFTQATNKVSQDEHSVSVVIRRTEPSHNLETIHYATKDDSAYAGKDYEAVDATLTFAPDESEKVVTIPILRNYDYSSGDKSFTLHLLNVKGTPSQRIFIEIPAPTADAVRGADAVVQEASRVATDLAGYAAKAEVLKGLVQAEKNDAVSSKHIADLIKVNEDNILSAQTRYLQHFKEFDNYPSALILSRLNDWIIELERRAYDQQKRATQILKDQYSLYLKSHMLEPGTWIEQLKNAVQLPQDKLPEDNTIQSM